MKKARILWVSGVCGIIIAGSVLWYGVSPQKTTSHVSLMPLIASEGAPPQSQSLANLCRQAKGPLYVNFWATWCGYCMNDLPALVTLARDHVPVVFINVDRDPYAAVSYVESKGFADQDFYRDPEGKAMDAMNIKGLPTTIKLDKNCQEVERHTGPLDSGVVAMFFDVPLSQLTL